MKNYLFVLLLIFASLTSMSQINQISIGLGRADQWGTSSYTYVGDTSIRYDSQRSMDSRTIYMVSMDHSIGKFQMYQVLAFSVMFPEYTLLVPGRYLLNLRNHQLFMKAPTFDYSISSSILKPTKRLTLYGGLNVRVQWPLKPTFSPNLDKWLTDWILDGSNSFAPITLGIIGDVTSSARDFEHKGQTVNMASAKMNKIYLVFSGPVFRRGKPAKKLIKKDFIRN